MDIIDVIHEVAHEYPGGVVALAARMDRSADTLRKKVLPTNDTHDLTVKELRKIVAYCDTDKIAKAFAEDRGLMCIKKPDFEALSDKEILDLFLDLQAQQGEWAREISKAMSSGDIDFDEMTRIRKEYDEFVVAAAEVMSRLQCFMAVSEERKSAKRKG